SSAPSGLAGRAASPAFAFPRLSSLRESLLALRGGPRAHRNPYYPNLICASSSISPRSSQLPSMENLQKNPTFVFIPVIITPPEPSASYLIPLTERERRGRINEASSSFQPRNWRLKVAPIVRAR